MHFLSFNVRLLNDYFPKARSSHQSTGTGRMLLLVCIYKYVRTTCWCQSRANICPRVLCWDSRFCYVCLTNRQSRFEQSSHIESQTIPPPPDTAPNNPTWATAALPVSHMPRMTSKCQQRAVTLGGKSVIRRHQLLPSLLTPLRQDICLHENPTAQEAQHITIISHCLGPETKTKQNYTVQNWNWCTKLKSRWQVYVFCLIFTQLKNPKVLKVCSVGEVSASLSEICHLALALLASNGSYCLCRPHGKQKASGRRIGGSARKQRLGINYLQGDTKSERVNERESERGSA